MANLLELYGPAGAGYLETERALKQEQAQKIQQAGLLTEIFQRQQKQQADLMEQKRQEDIRKKLAADPSLATARGLMGPKDLAHSLQEDEKLKAEQAFKMEDRKAQNENKILEIQERGRQRLHEIKLAVAEGRITKQQALEYQRETAIQVARTVAALRAPTPPEPLEKVVGLDGKVRLVKRSEAAGQQPYIAPTAQQDKAAATQSNLQRDLKTAIAELEEVTKDGNLIDQSTGSGIGAAVDWTAALAGVGTPGAQAAARLAPIFDLVLKMVPRFEGPQSDKDTASYRQAAGQIADPKVPNSTKKMAAREILRLMKNRVGQFRYKDDPSGGDSGGGQNATTKDDIGPPPPDVDPALWEAMTPEGRALWRQ